MTGTSAADAPPDMTATAWSRRQGLRLLAAMVAAEVRSGLRSPEFAIGVIGVPVILYAMFGLPPAANELPGGTRIGTMMLVSMTAYGVVSLAIFALGDELAKERGRGWQRTLRATPIPTWVHLGAKLAMSVVYAALIVGATSLLAATAGGVALPMGTWAALTATMIAGVLAFSTFGLALAYVVRPRTASIVANLVFLPLAFCSGFFFPLGELPTFLQRLAPYLPTYHFGRLAWQQVAAPADVEAFTGIPAGGQAEHLLWVIGSMAAFAVAALLAARREAVTRRG